jgi:hypothetical protein
VKKTQVFWTTPTQNQKLQVTHSLQPPTPLWQSCGEAGKATFLLTAKVAWMCLGLEKWNKLKYQNLQPFLLLTHSQHHLHLGGKVVEKQAGQLFCQQQKWLGCVWDLESGKNCFTKSFKPLLWAHQACNPHFEHQNLKIN